MNNLESGKELIFTAGRIKNRDLEVARQEDDFNMVVRRAQEVVELTLKGALKILGIEYPKVHDVAKIFAETAKKKLGKIDSEVLNKITYISARLSEDRIPSFYGDRTYSNEEAEEAYRDALFVFEKTKEILRI